MSSKISQRKRGSANLIPGQTKPIQNEGSAILGSSSQMQKSEMPSPRPYMGTLNYFARKKQLERVNNDNIIFMKSLNAVKPTLNRDDWKVHKNKAEKYKKIISSQRGNQSKNSFYIHKLIDYYRHHNKSRTPLLEEGLPLLSNVSVIMINE